MVLHQGRIERFFLDNISKFSSAADAHPISVERGILPLSISLDESQAEDPDAYPVTMKIRHLEEEEAAPEQSKAGNGVGDGLFRSNLAPDDTADMIRKSSGMEGREEVVRAKYVVGCDGAHSWVRGELGFKLEGEPTDYIWGVLDVVPITDFRELASFDITLLGSSSSLSVFGLLTVHAQRISGIDVQCTRPLRAR